MNETERLFIHPQAARLWAVVEGKLVIELHERGWTMDEIDDLLFELGDSCGIECDDRAANRELNEKLLEKYKTDPRGRDRYALQGVEFIYGLRGE